MRYINTEIVSHVSQIPILQTRGQQRASKRQLMNGKVEEDWFKLTTFSVSRNLRMRNGGNKIRDFIILEVHSNGVGGGGG